MAFRALNDEEIFKILANCSDIEDGNESQDEDLVEYDVENVDGNTFEPIEREIIPDCGEALDEVFDLELPLITEAEISEMGILIKNELPASSIQNLLTFTAKKDISWRKTRIEHSSTSFKYQRTQAAVDLEIGTPFSYFNKYLTDDFFIKTAYHTNLYAQQNGQLNFTECSVNEVRIVFAHHIMMGVLKFPRVDMFYDPSIGISFFRENMTRKRFFSIRNNLHLVDVMGKKEAQDRLYKVQPIIDTVKKRLWSLPLEENLCIDEQIIPFKGKFAAKQYIKGKPTPWGIKVFFLCGKSGIPYDFLVYQGSTTPIDKQLVKAVGFGSAVVLHLCQRIPSMVIGHNLFFDNYFPSYQLFEILKQRKINAAGTIRVNRFANPRLPSEKEMKSRGRGSSAECIDANDVVIITRWYDNKVINLGSNFVGIGVKDKAKRWEKDSNEFIDIDRPQVVRMYNESMGGVDLLDQMIQYYRINIRSVKWTLRVIMHFVDLALTAAWLEYRRDCTFKNIPKKYVKDSMNFRIAVAKTLLAAEQKNIQPDIARKRGRPSKTKSTENSRIALSSESDTESDNNSMASDEPKRKKIFQTQPPPEVRLDQIRHLPEFLNVKSAGRCKAKNCGKSSFIICRKCNVYLCVKREANCFLEYHKNK